MTYQTRLHALAGTLAIAALPPAGPAIAADPDSVLVVEPGNIAPHVARRIEDSARAGLPSLIRYINRSHFMHQLRVEDVVKEVKNPRPDAVRVEATPEERAALASSTSSAR